MAEDAYGKSLLETPGRILAEDDEYVVVALRLPKDKLAEYLPLLMALAQSAAQFAD